MERFPRAETGKHSDSEHDPLLLQWKKYQLALYLSWLLIKYFHNKLNALYKGEKDLHFIQIARQFSKGLYIYHFQDR